MGNTETIQNNPLKDWQKVDVDNGLEIFKNSKTNELSQKRIVTLEPDIDVKKQVTVYKMRQNNNDALVRAYGSQELTKKAESFVSCTGQNKIFVMTQKMSYRLSELPQLTFPETLLFLRQSLRAYQKLFKDYGPVEVNLQMIGLNYLGEVKSWLNSNWALNHRNHEYGNLRSKKVADLTREQYLAYREQYLDQPQMIKNIISVIEKKCEEGKFPQAFKEEVISQSTSFKKLLLYLKDFVEYNQIYVPEKINHEELFNTKFPTRLQQQLNFKAQRPESQAGNRPGQTNAQVSNAQQQQVQNSFFNMFLPGQQQSSQGVLIGQQQQVQASRPLEYQSGSQQFEGFSQLARIPEPLKQSPVSSDMGQVTFSQSTRNYNQQNLSGSQPITSYQWQRNQNLFTPSFQKIQQSPQVSSYSSNQPAQNLRGISTTQQTVIKPKYPGQTSVNQNIYQGGNYTLQGDNTGRYPSSNNISNNDFSYSKYASSTYGTSPTPLNQAQPNNANFGLSNNTYNFSKTYSTTPNPSFGIESTQNYQTPALNDNLASNKWTFSTPTSTFPTPTSTYTTETYNYTALKPSEQSYTTQKISTYTFDPNPDFGSKFGTGYTGTGYSNTLTKYESEISTNPSTNFNVQGKYTETFNSLLNPTVRAQTFEEITSGQTYATGQQKSQSSNISGSNVSGRNVISEQQSQTPKNINPLEAFANVVERRSNDVSESFLKIE